MRTSSPRKPSPTEPPHEPPSRTGSADDGCIYCLPPGDDEPVPTEPKPSHECMIKRLGSWERRQVSVVLHKAGFEDHLFNCGCPASKTHAFRDCPFYENETDLVEDEL